MNDLDLLAPLGRVDPPDEDTMRGIAALFVAEAAEQPRTPARHGRRLVIAGGALASAAAVVAVVSLIAQLTSPPPSAEKVRDLVLTAFDSSDAILHEHTVLTNAGDVPMTTDEWFSTMHPVVGERVIQRGVAVYGTRLNQDFTYSYAWPAPGPAPADCRDAGGSGRIGEQVWVDGEVVVVDHVAENWSEATHTCLATGLEKVVDVRAGIASGQWKLTPGTTTVDGQPAIELTKTDETGQRTLWANADSYLPIRERVVHGTSSTTADYMFLADTAENRAQLQTPVPPGYRQVRPGQQH